MTIRTLIALILTSSASMAFADSSICQVIPARDKYNTQIAAITVDGEPVADVITTYLALKAVRKLEALNACSIESVCRIGRVNDELNVLVNGMSLPVEDLTSALNKLAELNSSGACG